MGSYTDRDFGFFHVRKLSSKITDLSVVLPGYLIAPEIMHIGAPEVFLRQKKAGMSPHNINLHCWCDVKPNHKKVPFNIIYISATCISLFVSVIHVEKLTVVCG